jgi:hypothetical protein
MTTSDRAPDLEIDAIARIVARADRAQDWGALARLAARDPGAYERLAMALHDEARVRWALRPAIAAADAVDLPLAASRRRVLPWTAAAAVAVLAAVGLGYLWRPSPASAPSPAAPASAAITLEELPRVVLEARPARDGRGTEVVWLRRTLQRAVVDRVVELAHDEYGLPRPHQVDAAVLRGGGRY